MRWKRVAAGAAAVVGAVAAHDVTQKKHTILRNFPVVGHLRFALERFGPELRQYIVTSNDEERPFSRDQRQLGLRLGQGRERLLRVRHRQQRGERRGLPGHQAPDLRRPGRTDRRHAGENVPMPMAKVLGAARGRAQAFRPASVVNISGMSFGALSRQRRGGAQPRGARGGLPAEHGRGGARAVPPQRRRADLPDRHVVLRLPRRARAASTWPGSRTWSRRRRSAPSRSSFAGREAGARRHASGGQGQPRDRRDPGHPSGPGLRLAQPAPGLQRRRLDARLRRADRRPRPGCRSASSPRSAT